MAQGRRSLAIMPGCQWSRKQFDVIAETAQFADHLARPQFLRFFADGWPAFLVPNALVQDLPNETTEPVSDGTDCLRVPEVGHEPAIHDGEDRPFGFHGGVRCLIQDASHLAVALRTAVRLSVRGGATVVG